MDHAEKVRYHQHEVEKAQAHVKQKEKELLDARNDLEKETRELRSALDEQMRHNKHETEKLEKGMGRH